MGSLDWHTNVELFHAGTDTKPPGCSQGLVLELCNEVFHIPSPAGTTTAPRCSSLGVCCRVWLCWQPPELPEHLSHT